MPLFFFHTHYPDCFVPDTEGLIMSGQDEAIRETTRSLGELARDQLPGMEEGGLGVSVRDADNRVVFTARLRFEMEQ